MGNPDQGEVDLDLKGKTYRLVYSNRTVRILEQSLGYSMGYLYGNFEKLAGFDFLVKCVHAGLQYEGSPHAKLSQNRIADLLPSKFEVPLGEVIKGLIAWRGPADENEEKSESSEPAAGPT